MRAQCPLPKSIIFQPCEATRDYRMPLSDWSFVLYTIYKYERYMRLCTFLIEIYLYQYFVPLNPI